MRPEVWEIGGRFFVKWRSADGAHRVAPYPERWGFEDFVVMDPWTFVTILPANTGATNAPSH